VKPGPNAFQLRTGDAFGQRTRAVVVTANTADENSFLRPVIRPPREFKPGDKTGRVIGPFTARLGTPYAAKIAWFTVGGTFVSDAMAPTKSQARIDYLVSPNGDRPAEEWPDLPAYQAGERYYRDRLKRLPQPVQSVYFAIQGEPALDALRMTAHVLEDHPRESSPLIITHRWTEAGTAKEHSFTTADPTARYEFAAGSDVVNDAIEWRIDGTPR
jgi:hypothetical protein